MLETKSYRLTSFVAPVIEEEKANEIVQLVKNKIEDQKGIIQNYSEKADTRQLAYPIGGFKEAFYFTADFSFPTAKMPQFNNFLNEKKEILRYLITVNRRKKSSKKSTFRENKKMKLSQDLLASKMIDKIETLPDEKTTSKKEFEAKEKDHGSQPNKHEEKTKPTKKEKTSLEDLDKKLDKILNE